jgi:hypothetical protein
MQRVLRVVLIIREVWKGVIDDLAGDGNEETATEPHHYHHSSPDIGSE